jgi:hypothetical protein
VLTSLSATSDPALPARALTPLFVVVSRRLAHDPQWQSIARYTMLAGIVASAGFAVGGALVVPETAPLHDWVGLYQRLIILAVIFPCRIVLSLRLLQVASAAVMP